jgi:hypothetical protein
VASRTLADYRTELAEHGFGDLPTITLDRAVNNAYEEFVAIERWPFLIKEVTGTLAAGQQVLSVPTDCADVVSLTVDAQSQVLTPMVTDEFRKRFVGRYTDQGLPYLYYFVGAGVSQAVPASYSGNRGGGAINQFATTAVLNTVGAIANGSKAVLTVAFDNAAVLNTITGGGVTWTINVQKATASTPSLVIASADCPNGMAASAITLTFSGNISRVSWSIYELAFAATGNPVAGFIASNGGISTSPDSGLTASPAAVGDFVAGAIAYNAISVVGDWTQGPGFTKENTQSAGPATPTSMWGEFQVAAAAGTQKASGTTTLGSTNWNAAVVVFPQSAGYSSNLKVFPIPDAVYTYMLEYRIAPNTLVATSDSPLIPARFHRLLSFRALSYLHAQEDNPTMAGFWENQYMEGIGRMREEAWMQQSDRPNTILNVDDDW